MCCMCWSQLSLLRSVSQTVCWVGVHSTLALAEEVNSCSSGLMLVRLASLKIQTDCPPAEVPCLALLAFPEQDRELWLFPVTWCHVVAASFRLFAPLGLKHSTLELPVFARNREFTGAVTNLLVFPASALRVHCKNGDSSWSSSLLLLLEAS